MPQMRNTTTEEYGADDEVKKFANEYEDENAANETNVDLVNDIKSDLIKKDAERHVSEVGRYPKLHPQLLLRRCDNRCRNEIRSSFQPNA